MDAETFWRSITSPYTIVLALILAILARPFTKVVDIVWDNLGATLSTRLQRRHIARVERRNAIVEQLAGSEHQRVLLATSEIRCRIRAVTGFIVALAIFPALTLTRAQGGPIWMLVLGLIAIFLLGIYTGTAAAEAVIKAHLLRDALRKAGVPRHIR